MPELPEVETTLRGILPLVKEQVVMQVIVRNYQLRWPIPLDLPAILCGQKILLLERRAKYLLFRTQNGTLLVHLGMSGHLRLLADDQPVNKHDHVDIFFQNKKILRFTDPRRFGAFLWVEGDPYLHPLLRNLGVEPLTKEFSGKYLWLQARNKKLSIKSFLMNAKIVTGVGNIYAAEALFAARIHPAQSVNSLSLEQFNSLVAAVKLILKQAIKQGGTTLKDFRNSKGKPGYFSLQLKVYGRSGKPCEVCHNRLELLRIGQRSTVYCGVCQNLTKVRKR